MEFDKGASTESNENQVSAVKGSEYKDGVSQNRSAPPSHRIVRILRRYWYLLLLVVVVIGALVVWRVNEVSNDAAWNKASDYFGRADYAASAKLIGDKPVPTDEKRLTVYSQTMLATRELDKALSGYKSLYEKKKDPSIKIIIGNIYNEQKKYDDASKVYQDIINTNSTYVQAYVNLATLYKLQGKNQDAVDTAKQGVRANPNSATLYELLVSMLLEKKDSDDFKQAVEALKKLNPSDPLLESLKN